MRQLIYTSSAHRNTPESTLLEILETSRRNNSAADITGVLLYIDGGFLQVLEGSSQDVGITFHRIARDKRHWNTSVLMDRTAERAFGEWSMGFERPTEEGPSQGIFHATADAIAGRPRKTAGADLIVMLRTFYRVQSRADLASG
jgi:hypothetical protein